MLPAALVPTLSSPPRTLELEPAAGAIGAYVYGVDLTASLDDATIRALELALAEHQVLFFREQRLTAAGLLALGKRFGPISTHPAYPHPDHPEVALLEHTAERPSKIDEWHTDMTFLARPPLGSILQGLIIPAVGGDTLWSSAGAVFESLSDRMQRLIDGLTASHSFAHGFKETLAEAAPDAPIFQVVREHPPVVHPVVRTHPVTGRKGLFVNRLFTTHICELRPAESRAVLELLWQQIEAPEYTCRFHWAVDSVAFWDNRSTFHRPVNDHGRQHRKMQRVTIEGDVPG